MEKIDDYKQTINQFLFSEFIVFISQVAVFFLVAVFMSGFLENETNLLAFAEQKINDNTKKELGLTFLSFFLVLGFFSAIKQAIDNKRLEYFINRILWDIAKTIYTFGAGITGSVYAMALYIHLNPDESIQVHKIVIVTTLAGLVTFLYGCGWSWLFKRKTHILSKSNERIGASYENEKAKE